MARYENPFEWFRRELSPLFDRAFPSLMNFETPWERNWGFEMKDMENEFVVRVEVPGFEAKELEVSLTGNVLTIRAEHREAAEAEAERPYARLERSMTLPVGADLERIEAKYHNGVLEVHVPKTAEAKSRPIEVKT
jgi:HSP20 family protein